VTNLFSRIFMDPERFDSPDEEMNEVGMGVVYTRTTDGRDLYDPPLDAEEVRGRTEKYYATYSRDFERMVAGILEYWGRCLIVDLHSYTTVALPHERHQDDARPPVCLGFDDFHAPDVAALARSFGAAGFETATNQPFRGSYVPLSQYQVNPLVQSVMVEIRKDQYLGPDGALGQAPSARLAGAVADFIAEWMDAVPGRVAGAE
jgi:N-formylglutamate amidohydrolase